MSRQIVGGVAVQLQQAVGKYRRAAAGIQHMHNGLKDL